MTRLHSTDGDYEELTLFFKTTTDKAILVSDNGMDWVWLPKSQLEDIGPVILEGETPEITIVIPVWLAESKGLV